MALIFFIQVVIMTTPRILLIFIAVLVLSEGVSGQSKVDPYDFLEEWDLLGQDFRRGKLELMPEGVPPGFDTDVSKPSEDGYFQVCIEPEIIPVPLNQIHTWLIQIKKPDGKPVSGADISFFGSMPLHGHGFPTAPQITGEVDPGVYALEGIKFSMSGWWAMGMGIAAGDKTDRVGFNIVFEP